MDELKARLEKDGWQIHPQWDQFYRTNWYACLPLPGCLRECASNKNPVQLVLQPYRFSSQGNAFDVCEISLAAAHPTETWWKLSRYSLSPDEAARDWRAIGASLQKAWEAL